MERNWRGEQIIKGTFKEIYLERDHILKEYVKQRNLFKQMSIEEVDDDSTRRGGGLIPYDMKWNDIRPYDRTERSKAEQYARTLMYRV